MVNFPGDEEEITKVEDAVVDEQNDMISAVEVETTVPVEETKESEEETVELEEETTEEEEVREVLEEDVENDDADKDGDL